jgi:hypothetical protein
VYVSFFEFIVACSISSDARVKAGCWLLARGVVVWHEPRLLWLGSR